MKVTAIKQQVKRADRYSIFVDEKYAFSLSEAELIARGIHSGQELSREELAKFREISKLDKVYGLVLRLIVRRPRSEKELRDYFKRKNQDESAAQTILNKLSNIGLLNDEDFARRWVGSRRLLKPVSKRRLVRELRQKGITNEIIDKTLAEDQTTDLDTLKELIERKRKQTKYQDTTKLIQYLARQGYNYDDIKTAVGPEA